MELPTICPTLAMLAWVYRVLGWVHTAGGGGGRRTLLPLTPSLLLSIVDRCAAVRQLGSGVRMK